MQIIAGAFVAGLDAGMGYNTWPLMDGALVPAGLGAIDPWWKNIFENAMTVQFIHRTIAYVIVLYVAGLWLWKRGNGGFAGANGWLPRIALLVLLQVVLGIGTLVMHVPLPLPSAIRRWPSCSPARRSPGSPISPRAARNFRRGGKSADGAQRPAIRGLQRRYSYTETVRC